MSSLDLLKTYFGYDTFRDGQETVIENLIAGRSAAAVFPTGGGKSLCYQLPALQFEGLTLVISPLIALMKDQIDALEARGIAARRLDSSLTIDEYRSVMDDVRAGRVKLLYVAPERFNNERFRESMQRVRVSLFAVDEAHCISEWGHNFRPDYLKLAGFAKQFKAERVLALTATATPPVLKDMCRVFEIDESCATCTGFYRNNLTLLMTPLDSSERDQVLSTQLGERPPGPTIVYVTLQKTAMEVAARLAALGFEAKPYHAGLKPEQRTETQDWFLASDSGIVVATIAFGMGVDKPNIRYVYHYNMPKGLENYSQEIGRAGRDGNPATCEVLACSDDLTVLENFAHGDTPTLDSVQRLVEALFSKGNDFDVSYYELSGVSDIRLLVIRTLITYLELDGYLEGGTPFYSGYQFKPNMPSAEILAKFNGERRDFLKSLLAQSKKKLTWFSIDLEQASTKLKQPRERLVAALDYLGEQGMLELKVEGVRNRYRLLRAPADHNELAVKLHQQVLLREQRELERLDQVVQLIELPSCQVAHLCEHFGKPLDANCGHCSWCLSGASQKVSERSSVAMSATDCALVRQVALQLIGKLSDHIGVARFLCGLASPAISKARLQSDPRFGRLEHLSYRTVLAEVQRSPES